MKFWDSSAIAALLLPEGDSERMARHYREDGRIFVWWATPVECTSAIARREREGLPARIVREGITSLREMEAQWVEVAPHTDIRDGAIRLLRMHALRAADALQLAAALFVADGNPESLDFLVLDIRLAAAAAREGFTVLGLES